MNNTATAGKLNITIDLGVMSSLGLTLEEYSVAYLINFQQTNPISEMSGWCAYSATNIGTSLNISKDTVLRIMKKLHAKGLVERFRRTQLIRTTLQWYGQFCNTDSKMHAVLTKEKESNKEKEYINIFNTNVLKAPKEPKYAKETNFRNPNVDRILKEFTTLTGLSKPTDKIPGRWAHLFSTNKAMGVEHFTPCLKHLLKEWDGLQITKIETIYRNYPVYEATIKKQQNKTYTPPIIWEEDEEVFQNI